MRGSPYSTYQFDSISIPYVWPFCLNDETHIKIRYTCHIQTVLVPVIVNLSQQVITRKAHLFVFFYFEPPSTVTLFIKLNITSCYVVIENGLFQFVVSFSIQWLKNVHLVNMYTIDIAFMSKEYQFCRLICCQCKIPIRCVMLKTNITVNFVCNILCACCSIYIVNKKSYMHAAFELIYIYHILIEVYV